MMLCLPSAFTEGNKLGIFKRSKTVFTWIQLHCFQVQRTLGQTS